MVNETVTKFGYPKSLLREYDYWVVLLRPKQITAGSVVLACKEEKFSFSDISSQAFTEMKVVTSDLETALARAFDYDKINYLLLMMVDKHVHFHVIPRYQKEVELKLGSYQDLAWPGPPDLTRALDLEPAQQQEILQKISSNWPG